MRLLLLLSFFFTCAAIKSLQALGGDARSSTYDDAEFVFGHDNVCSVSDEKACIILGSPWNERAIRSALPGYKITYSSECEGFCFFTETDKGILEILGSEGKVALLRSMGGSVDFRGNAIGDKLKNAVGYGVSCFSGLNFVCTDSTLSPIGYIVDGCDEAFGSHDSGGATVVPNCATISGFELGRLEYLEESVSEPEDGNDGGGGGLMLHND